ncbi:MAG: MarR family transcriptional regulator [Eubacteriales bacterium]|nr:MarR family transcriptional regulator [Eubacteriales bacterium]
MDTLKRQLMELNQLCNEIDGIYHDIAHSHGISDNIFWILYILYNSDTPISQSSLCENWFFSKQTVNSSISSMTKRGWVTLEVVPGTRNRKNILLTEAGQNLCAKVIGKTHQLEQAAFSKMSSEERETYISLFRIANRHMRSEYNKQYEENH